MKRVELKRVKIDYGMDDEALTPDNVPEFLDYKMTMMGLLKTPKDPQQGATFEETAEAMPIWKKFRDLRKDADHILLEDAEHKFVTACVVENARYVQRSYELFEMGEMLKNAPDHLTKAEKTG